LATGNVYITQNDINLPGLGGLHLTRTWNSIWPATQNGMVPFMFGPNWTVTYQERVYIGSDDSVKFARWEGSFWSFSDNGMGEHGNQAYSVTAPGNAGAAALQDTSNNWTITLKNGEQHRFDPVSGSLIAIVDRNGNTTTIAHDAMNRIATVTDPVSRHLYFNYVNNSSFLVSSVTSDVGITVSYTYDAQGRLSQVTKPDQTTISFQYDGNSNVTAVLDTNGKILESHTYDNMHRGLTSSRANGVDSVSVQYPAASNPGAIKTEQ
jgi:YD repeat-containing protein